MPSTTRWTALLCGLVLAACATAPEVVPVVTSETFRTTIEGLHVTVDASALTGDYASYAWDFGDGRTSSGPTSAHTYAAGGGYQIALRATSRDDAVSTFVTLVILRERGVDNQPPQASFTISAANGTAPLSVTFESTSSDPDGVIVSHDWDFGDGSTAQGDEVTHVYQSAGAYTVTLTVTDDRGASAQAQAAIGVTAPDVNQPPAASIKASPTAGPAPLIATFASTSTDPDGTIVTTTWDFGDGTTADGQEADHTFDEPGSYTVTLTVTDDRGASSQAQVSITVTPEETRDQFPIASFTANPIEGVAPHGVGFVSTSTHPDPEGEIVRLEWSFGDGTTAIDVAVVRHLYEKPGTYLAALLVTDAKGNQSRAVQEIFVAAP